MTLTRKTSLGVASGLGLVAGLMLTGCADDQPPAPPAPVEAEDETAGDGSGAPTQDDTTGVTFDATQAAELALGEIDDGVVVEVNLDRDDGDQKWEVDVVDGSGAGTEFEIVGGNIVSDKGFDPDDEELESHDVLAVEAIGIAEDEVSASLIEIQLDRENGTLVWDVELRGEDGAEYDFDIDAMTGDVLGR